MIKRLGFVIFGSITYVAWVHRCSIYIPPVLYIYIYIYIYGIRNNIHTLVRIPMSSLCVVCMLRNLGQRIIRF